MLAVLAVVALLGFPYYRLPAGLRVRDPLHAWLKPSGYVGQTAGVIGFLMFAFLWLYPLRKKVKALAWTGSVGKWLDVHVVAALGLPLLVAIHAAWKFEGLIGLGYASMMVVCLSGIIGRYLYARIPRSRSGVELTREEVASQRSALVTEIAAATGQTPDEVLRTLDEAAGSTASGLAQALVRMVGNDVLRWRTTRRLRREWSSAGPGGQPLPKATVTRLAALVNEEIALAQQARLLEATQTAFRYWHVAHRPFAITALIAVTVHVAVVVAMGATWFW
ncbi:MAG TPA: hypothetical protein VFY20_12390 [Gemmatimonadales bacterium]|nr:hypothetical protein [Gemmatimonadales bacterium]